MYVPPDPPGTPAAPRLSDSLTTRRYSGSRYINRMARHNTVLHLAVGPTTPCRVDSITTSLACPQRAGVFQSIPGGEYHFVIIAAHLADEGLDDKGNHDVEHVEGGDDPKGEEENPRGARARQL
eukprot:1143358-Pyramimonas_sp.AAC.3